MRFLFTMSSCQKTEDRTQRPDIASVSVPIDRFFRSPLSAPSLGPSRKTTIFKPYVSSEYLKPSTKAVRLSVFCFPLSDLRALCAPWWSQTGSNRRPHACKARALPTELWPRRNTEDRKQTTDENASVFRSLFSVFRSWWAWEDSNLRPHAYQARALTN
jgi:hypothetical protein